MTIEHDPVVLIRRLLAEELHLLGQEIEDAHPAGRAGRRNDVTETLDEIGRLVGQRPRIGRRAAPVAATA